MSRVEAVAGLLAGSGGHLVDAAAITALTLLAYSPAAPQEVQTIGALVAAVAGAKKYGEIKRAQP